MTDLKLRQEKKEEFQKGNRPDGSEIGAYRSRAYSLFKSTKNPLAGGYVDLILTGSFTNRLFVKKVGNAFQFDSQDSKSMMLFEKYGQDLRTINDITFERAQKERYAPELIKLIKQKIGQ